MLTIDALKEYGANVDEGLGRCMGNEALYLKLVNTIPNEKNFDALKRSLDVHDLEAAFDAAHALKGITGNLALTPLYEPIVEITELLRTKQDIDYSDKLAVILESRDKLKSISYNLL